MNYMRIAIIWIFVTTILSTILISKLIADTPPDVKTYEILQKHNQKYLIEELLKSESINKELLLKKYSELNTGKFKNEVLSMQFESLGYLITLIIFIAINLTNAVLLTWIFTKLSSPKKDAT